MQIIMIEQYSGPRYDGRQWPPAGQPFDVPDDEGKALIAHGVARPVPPPKPAPAKSTPAKADPPPADPPAAAPAGKARATKDKPGE